MPKAHSIDLFDLIKSLSPAEKGYIKKYALRNSTKGNLVYLSLFNDIERQKAYNDEDLLKNLKYQGQFPQLKKYLYSAICKALNAFHAESGPRSQLRNMLNMIEILYDKGLEAQCRKILVNAKKIARIHELYPYLIELLHWEKGLNAAIENQDSEQESEKIYTEEKEYLENLKTMNDYWQQRSKFVNFTSRSFTMRSVSELEELKKFTDNPLFKSEEIPTSWKVKVYFHNMRGLYFTITGDAKKASFHHKECLNLFESYPEKFLHDPGSYLTALNDCFLSFMDLKEYTEVERLIGLYHSLKNFKLDNLNIRCGTFLLYGNQLHFYLTRGEFEKGVALVEKIEPLMQQYLTTIPKAVQLILCINYAIVNFGTGSFGNALKWVNRILINDSSNLRNDIVCFARIFSLIIHFELNNIDMLEYTVKSTYRFLYKRGGLYKYETAILHFIKYKISQNLNKKELIQAFIDLKEELEEIVRDPLEQNALESFNLIYWLRSKIENRPFKEILREKLEYK